jgi:hypothetical protein
MVCGGGGNAGGKQMAAANGGNVWGLQMTVL